tara:strand:- start:3725 stop:5023 length:1299 start_codon:yes stop_codon:yes gene_type:complete
MDVNQMAKTKTGLPAIAEKRLMPYIERGIQNGVFSDAEPVVELFRRKATEDGLKETIDTLGGMKSEMAQRFVTDCVLTDLSAILRQKRYLAHMEIWEVAHRTVGIAKGNPRPVCFIYGQAQIESDGSTMEPAMFRMSLWDEDAALADDMERDGTYATSVSCRNLDAEVLDLRPLSGLTTFRDEEYEHADRAELLKETFEQYDIADLEDHISRSPQDLRLIEATVSYAGVQNSKSGSTFGKMLLKDDSTMTMEAIEEGETLLLNCLCSTDIAQRYGKYSRILALVNTRMNGEYGLSANLEVAIPLVVVAPPKVEVEATGGDDSEDDAASYFSDDSDLLDPDAKKDEEPATEAVEAEADDDEDVDLSALPVKVLKTMAKAAGHSGYSDMKKDDLVSLLSGDSDDSDDDEEEAEAPAPAEASDDSDDGDDWDDWD